MPAKRYQFQDGEVVREANVVRRISEAWREQIEEHTLRMKMEQEEKEKNNLELEMARKKWEKAEEEVNCFIRYCIPCTPNSSMSYLVHCHISYKASLTLY